VIYASDKTFLANYQLDLASKRTSQTQDVRFLSILDRHWLWAMSKK